MLDQRGEEVQGGRIGSTPHDLEVLVAALKKKENALQACLEACGCFIWIFDALAESLGRSAVHVAQSSRIHVIANKTFLQNPCS